MSNTILEQYKILVDFLGKALGPDYEIVLHDITSEPGQIIAIANSHISDRTIGNPIGLLGINFDDSRYRNLCDKLLLSLHPDEFSQAKNSFSLESPAPAEASSKQPDSLKEDFPMDISALMQKAFESATSSLDTPIDRLNQQEKRDIVQKLQERGVFKLKGGIAFAAKNLSCSPATVYRYLGDLEN